MPSSPRYGSNIAVITSRTKSELLEYWQRLRKPLFDIADEHVFPDQFVKPKHMLSNRKMYTDSTAETYVYQPLRYSML